MKRKENAAGESINIFVSFQEQKEEKSPSEANSKTLFLFSCFPFLSPRRSKFGGSRERERKKKKQQHKKKAASRLNKKKARGKIRTDKFANMVRVCVYVFGWTAARPRLRKKQLQHEIRRRRRDTAIPRMPPPPRPPPS